MFNIVSLILSLLYFLRLFFDPWYREDSFIDIPTILLFLCVFFLTWLGLFRAGMKKSAGSLLVPLLSLAVLFMPAYAPNFDVEMFCKPAFTACLSYYDGSHTIAFFPSGKFEIRVGSFLNADWHNGRWTRNGDVILLKYDNEPYKYIGSVLQLDGLCLYPIEAPDCERTYMEINDCNVVDWSILK